ncbi:hypothetical protein BD413DRAFT_445400, partial [Trametes elegans]
QYIPPNQWSQGTACGGCTIHPVASQTYQGTWHDTTYTPDLLPPRAINVTFTGTAVYVFNVLANNVPNALTTDTNLVFVLDGAVVDSFNHVSDGSSALQYNAMVFAQEGLGNVQHSLSISTAKNQSSVVLFDYLVYT